jgi:hypothetical protein
MNFGRFQIYLNQIKINPREIDKSYYAPHAQTGRRPNGAQELSVCQEPLADPVVVITAHATIRRTEHAPGMITAHWRGRGTRAGVLTGSSLADYRLPLLGQNELHGITNTPLQWNLQGRHGR